MMSYASRYFSRAEHSQLRDARSIVERLNEELVAADRRPIRCHEVARVVGRLLELPVVDGKYGPVEHSWLLTDPCSNIGPLRQRPSILDVYAVGRLPQVCLVEALPILPHTASYVPGEPRDDVQHDVVDALLAPFLEDEECPVHSYRCTPGYSWPEARYTCPYRTKDAPPA